MLGTAEQSINTSRCEQCQHNLNGFCSFDFPEFGTPESFDCNHFEAWQLKSNTSTPLVIVLQNAPRVMVLLHEKKSSNALLNTEHSVTELLLAWPANQTSVVQSRSSCWSNGITSRPQRNTHKCGFVPSINWLNSKLKVTEQVLNESWTHLDHS